MMGVSHTIQRVNRYPAPAAVLELLKPVTWFPPMWAFACGVVSSGVPVAGDQWWVVALGVALCGPLVCASSQAVNDWYDRHVDAINEPGRPIPSGRMPGRWGLYVAVAWTGLSLGAGALLGPAAAGATAVALAFAWAYSAPPVRLKRNGWVGNAAVGVTYEGLAWVTGAAVLLDGRMPGGAILALAALYSVGAHGILTLNDFKAIAGDRQMGVRSLPVLLGVPRAAWTACVVMIAPQVIVVALLAAWGAPLAAAIVAGLIAAQVALMARFLQAPVERALMLSAAGVPFSVLGMMVGAVAVRGLA
jgi:chlorophyll synthase